MPVLTACTARPLDLALTEPFGIATGAQVTAHNVLVRVELSDGSVGHGEAAPFPAVSGETQEQTLATLESASALVLGHDARRWRRLAASLHELAPGAPAARCAIESAVLDALCRSAGISLWHFFGGSEPELVSDITVTTGTAEHAQAAAARAERDGFTTLKVKIGGAPLDHDLARLIAICTAAPRAGLVLDANASLDHRDALALLDAMGPLRARVALFEQPTPAADLDGLARVRELGRVRVAADESARSARDVAALAQAGAADVINVKITKTSVAEALDVIATARSHGLGLMVGGMVETRLAMSVSACLAAGHGGFAFVDLDTPWFMADSPLDGGYSDDGPRLRVDRIQHGHGVCPVLR